MIGCDMSLLTSSEYSVACHDLRVNAATFDPRIPKAIWRATLHKCQQRARDGHEACDDNRHSPEVDSLPRPSGISHDVQEQGRYRDLPCRDAYNAEYLRSPVQQDRLRQIVHPALLNVPDMLATASIRVEGQDDRPPYEAHLGGLISLVLIAFADPPTQVIPIKMSSRPICLFRTRNTNRRTTVNRDIVVRVHIMAMRAGPRSGTECVSCTGCASC